MQVLKKNIKYGEVHKIFTAYLSKTIKLDVTKFSQICIFEWTLTLFKSFCKVYCIMQEILQS